MEITYVTIDAKQITTCETACGQQAVGGEGALQFAILPRRKKAAPPGKLLLFPSCPPGGMEDPPEPDPDEEETDGKKPKRERLFLALDLAATAGILGMTVAVVAAFLIH